MGCADAATVPEPLRADPAGLWCAAAYFASRAGGAGGPMNAGFEALIGTAFGTTAVAAPGVTGLAVAWARPLAGAGNVDGARSGAVAGAGDAGVTGLVCIGFGAGAAVPPVGSLIRVPGAGAADDAGLGDVAGFEPGAGTNGATVAGRAPATAGAVGAVVGRTLATGAAEAVGAGAGR